MDRIGGLVLAGGLASRMGGGQKALLELNGQPLLARVLAHLSDQVDTIAISANAELERYAVFGVPVLTDTMPGHLGPLAGVLSGLRWAEGAGLDHVVSVAGDTPFFPGDLVARLDAARRAGEGAIAMAATPDPERGSLRQPTFALWPTSLADDLEQALSKGIRKIVLWADRHGLELAAFPATPFDPFFNVNTPDDMQAAMRMVAEFDL